MNAVDASEHYDPIIAEETPSLLTVVIDTNPRAWAALRNILPIPEAIANVLVFINAHLALSNANQVAVIAAHSHRAVWLYPPPPETAGMDGTAEDVNMADAFAAQPKNSANKFPQFAQVETAVMSALRKLMASTEEADLATTTTQVSGALTMALCHINKTSRNLVTSTPKASDDSSKNGAGVGPLSSVLARILTISVSDSEPSQYIPTMNAVFAASHAQIRLDTLALSGNATFLQQAAFITSGNFLAASNPQGIISYLMTAFLDDNEVGQHFVTPTQDTVDFRAACFCHGRVVDTGFVCSICLSIFCEVPDGAECLTCGSKLALGSVGAKPVVVPRKKKKKKRLANDAVGSETGSATGTPRPN